MKTREVLNLGFFNKFGKKKNSDEASKPKKKNQKKTPVNDEQTESRNMINSMHIQSAVPERVLAAFKNHQDDAVITKCDAGYTAIAVSGSALKDDFGFSKDRGDTSIGTFTTDVRHGSILSVTLEQDRNDGYFVFVPTGDTLDALHCIDKIADNRDKKAFVWVIIPDDISEDNEEKPQSIGTNSLVSLNDLLRAYQHNPIVRPQVTQDEHGDYVVTLPGITGDAVVSADDAIADNEKTEEKPEEENPFAVMTEDDNDQVEVIESQAEVKETESKAEAIEENTESKEETTDGFPGSNYDAVDGITDEAETDKGEADKVNEESVSDNDDDAEKTNAKSDTNEDADDEVIPDGPFKGMTYDQMAQWVNKFGTGVEPTHDQLMEILRGNDDILRNDHAEEAQKEAKKAETVKNDDGVDLDAFIDQLRETLRHNYNDNDLGLKYDPHVLDSLLAEYQPYQLSLSDAQNGNDHLNDLVNSKRRDINDNLVNEYKKNTQSVVNNFSRAVRSLISSIEKIYSYSTIIVSDDGRKSFGKRRQELSQEYEEKRHNKDHVIDEKIRRLKDDYKEDKQEYMDAAAAVAGQEYDSQHHHELVAQIAQVPEDVSRDITQDYNIRYNELNNERLQSARQMFHKGFDEAVNKASDQRIASREKEKQHYKDGQELIDKLVHDQYTQDLRYQEDLRYAKEHDGKIAEMQESINQMRKAHQDELKKNNEAHQVELDQREDLFNDQLAKVRHDDNEEIKSIKQDFKKRLESKDDQLEKLKKQLNEYDDKQAEKIKEIKDSNHETVEHYENRIKELHNTLDDKDRQIDNVQGKLAAAYTDVDNDRKKAFWKKLGLGIVGIVFGSTITLGGIAIHDMNGTKTEPQTQQESHVQSQQSPTVVYVTPDSNKQNENNKGSSSQKSAENSQTQSSVVSSSSQK